MSLARGIKSYAIWNQEGRNFKMADLLFQKVLLSPEKSMRYLNTRIMPFSIDEIE